MDPKEKSQTRKNLDAAFAGESMAHQKYLYFAKLARDLGDAEVAALFEDTARQETGHAFAHLSLLYPADRLTVDQVLRLAIEGERYEHTVMYPGFEEQARREAEGAAEREFQDQAAESKEHEARFAAMLEKARRRFAALTQVEKMHADRYQSALEARQGATAARPAA
ncbi:MAG: rubrerythrin [Elusimicrobia bacterium]|nr:rubrerythrin [Elusimicrobiota bacterium]